MGAERARGLGFTPTCCDPTAGLPTWQAPSTGSCCRHSTRSCCMTASAATWRRPSILTAVRPILRLSQPCCGRGRHPEADIQEICVVVLIVCDFLVMCLGMSEQWVFAHASAVPR